MATNLSTMRNPGVDSVTLELPPVFPTCPVTGEPFLVSVTVEYEPTEDVIEYIEFEGWVRNQVLHTTMTLEEVVVMVMAHVKGLLGEDILACVIAKVIASQHCTATAVVYNGGLNE
jgi:NADPH-dependent 7-cyano-7-deazaguanine reductase QueF